MARGPVAIGNCSGFLGDRASAMRELLDGGQVDVITGDWLAELTMYILTKTRRPSADGWASPFVTQLARDLDRVVTSGVKVVANAGGLNPRGCAEAIRRIAEEAGLSISVASVTGDDLLPRIEQLRARSRSFQNIDTGEELSQVHGDILSANAYLGGWGIASALRAGADIVVTGRVTDASLVVGAAAWWHDWSPNDLDALAGAVVAGHVIECGAQATGGNYSFFRETDRTSPPGFPIAFVAADGQAEIGKAEPSGGAVTEETVTAQLLYEIGDERYLNPDVVARLDTATVRQVGTNRVHISGVKGEPPSEFLKVALNYEGGYRNTVSFVLRGLDIAEKADWVTRDFWRAVSDLPLDQRETHLEAGESDLVDGSPNALAVLSLTGFARERAAIGRAFSNKATEMALSSFPGFYMVSPPRDATAFGVYWPCLIEKTEVPTFVSCDDNDWTVPWVDVSTSGRALSATPVDRAAPLYWEAVHDIPIGRVLGARSGDKGGKANLGIWARSDDGFQWLMEWLTAEELARMMPELAAYPMAVTTFPNLRAVNVVISGLLGRGVAASARPDPQAKALGEVFRACRRPVPRQLITDEGK